MHTIAYPSTNANARRDGKVPNKIVLHYTGMRDLKAALERLSNPAYDVSCHYVVAENGDIYQMVDDQHRAWHAGVSIWKGEGDINSSSIGIEIENPGHEFGYRRFKPAQMESVARLCRALIKKHRIKARDILAHSDIAPNRKRDPGELFDWKFLAARGVGLWPKGKLKPARFENSVTGKKEVQTLLARIGYDVAITGRMDWPTRHALKAFQRRFRPRKVNGVMDHETLALLKWRVGKE